MPNSTFRIPNSELTFLAFAGSAPTVQIGWTPKAEGAAGLEALANVQLQQRTTIEEGLVRSRVLLNYAISRAELDKLTIEVPDDQKIVAVTDDNVRAWKISQGNKTQIIQVELFEPAKTRQNLSIDLEKFLQPSSKFSLSIPRIQAIGVGRQQGILAIEAAAGLAIEPKTAAGLIQIDPAELPPTLKIKDGGFTYRFSAAVYELALNIETEQPRIFAKTQTNITLAENGTYTALMTNVYQIERQGIFQLFYDIPEEYKVVRVKSELATRNVEANKNNSALTPSIDGFQVFDLPKQEGKPPMKRLTVNLSGKALGTFGVSVTLLQSAESKAQSAENKSQNAGADPTNNSELRIPNYELKLLAPMVAPDGIEQREGILILSAPESLRVTPTGFSGMQNVSFDDLAGKWLTPTENRGLFAYVFAEEIPELSLQITRRTPQVTVQQLLAAKIDDGVVRFEAAISYNVLYTGVKSLRIDVPKEIAKDLRNQTKDFRDTVLSPQPDDVAEGYEAWNFAKETSLIGNGTFVLAWEKQIPQLLDGKSVEIAIPRLIPRGVFRSWGQILLSKAETVDISASDNIAGLRQIDPQHDIEQKSRKQDAAYAFEFHDDWNLTLTATRYQLQEVKRASVEYGLLRAVLTRSNTISVQALYRIQSVKQRLPILLPPDSHFDVEPRINGTPVTLETDAAKQFLIPLTSTVPDTPFWLELRYTQKKENSRAERNRWRETEQISIPLFPDEPAIQHLYVAVYLPEEYALTSYHGNVSKNFSQERPTNDKNAISVFNTPTVETLISNMQNGISNDVSWRNFPVDGTAYLFSTVQPDKTSPELLRLVMRKTAVVNVLIFLILLAGGIVLTPYSWRIRGIAAFGLIAFYALLAFLFPTLTSLLVVTSGMKWAIGLTIVIWIIWSIAVGREKIRSILTTPIIPKKPQETLQPAVTEIPETEKPESDTKE